MVLHRDLRESAMNESPGLEWTIGPGTQADSINDAYTATTRKDSREEQHHTVLVGPQPKFDSRLRPPWRFDIVSTHGCSIFDFKITWRT